MASGPPHVADHQSGDGHRDWRRDAETVCEGVGTARQREGDHYTNLVIVDAGQHPKRDPARGQTEGHPPEGFPQEQPREAGRGDLLGARGRAEQRQKDHHGHAVVEK